MMVHLFDDGFIPVNKALNHSHVLFVGTMEDVDNVANEEGNHAQEYITQGIIEKSHG